MEKIIINKDNIIDEDITEVVQRAKVLIVNSQDEILLGHCYNNYQFPGGHVEAGESLIAAVNREITEETGMVLNLKDIEPFAQIVGYYKDWPQEGKNRKNEIYYYAVKTDELPNLANTIYTADELAGHFELKYVPLKNVLAVLQDNALKYGDTEGIAQEMMNILKIYLNKNN